MLGEKFDHLVDCNLYILQLEVHLHSNGQDDEKKIGFK